jgi:single-strand DNA-binding protein
MADLNKVILKGRLTASPELRHTSSDIAVTSFTVASNGYAKTGEEAKANFVDCVAWRNTADFVSKYFDKGSSIIVEGSLQTRSYTDKNDVKRKATEVVVEKVYFDGKKNDNNSANNQSSQQKPTISTGDNGDFIEINGDDDLPF